MWHKLKLTLPVATVVALSVYASLFADMALWVYWREKIAVGEWWRLFSGHTVHFDVWHLVLNIVALIIIWLYVERLWDWYEWIIILLFCSLGVSVGLWWGNDELIKYGGLSGVLHGILTLACVQRLWVKDILSAGALVVIVVKIAWEQTQGGIQDNFLSVPTAVDAHLYGVISGALWGLLLVMWNQSCTLLRRSRQ